MEDFTAKTRVYQSTLAVVEGNEPAVHDFACAVAKGGDRMTVDARVRTVAALAYFAANEHGVTWWDATPVEFVKSNFASCALKRLGLAETAQDPAPLAYHCEQAPLAYQYEQ